MSNTTGVPPLTEIRVRGIHFDLKGDEPWTMEQLLNLGGFFQYRDVKHRLGQPESRLRRFLSESTFPAGVLWQMRLSEKEGSRTNLYLNLPEFVKILQARFSAVTNAAGLLEEEEEEPAACDEPLAQKSKRVKRK